MDLIENGDELILVVMSEREKGPELPLVLIVPPDN